MKSSVKVREEVLSGLHASTEIPWWNDDDVDAFLWLNISLSQMHACTNLPMYSYLLCVLFSLEFLFHW